MIFHSLLDYNFTHICVIVFKEQDNGIFLRPAAQSDADRLKEE